jgi:hypothetical protein
MENLTHEELKEKYDILAKNIAAMHTEQNLILGLIQKVCSHENFTKLMQFTLFDEDEDDEVKYKCNDCYCYFTESELLHK